MSRYAEIAAITVLAVGAVFASGMYLSTIWPDPKPQTAEVKDQPRLLGPTVNPGGAFYRYDDTELNVTCWGTSKGLSCMPNWMLIPNKDHTIATEQQKQGKQNAKD